MKLIFLINNLLCTLLYIVKYNITFVHRKKLDLLSDIDNWKKQIV